MDEPDPQLIATARRGDLRAFDSIVRRYQGEVWRLCFHLLGDREIASDVTQDTFVRVYRALPNFRGTAKFSTWLFTVTNNCVIDEMRKQKRRRALSQTFQQERLPPPRENLGARLEMREVLEALAPELRGPLVLVDMLGLTYADASSVLGVPIGTLKSRIHRGRVTLAKRLAPGEEDRRDEA